MTCGSAPPLNVNQPVMFDTSGTLPTVGGVALDPNKVYYIRSITGNNVTIGTVYNGAAVTFDGAGTGTHNLRLVWATYEPVTAWIDMTDTTLVFKDYTSNDFRPTGTGSTPAAQAKMVDYSIVTALVSLGSDIADKERPNYNNGGAEYKDAGPFEYDRGYGPHPASGTISLTNIVADSRVLITKSDGSVLYNDVPGTSLSFTTTHIGNFDVVVRKASASPFYREFQASGATIANQTTSIKCLQQLDE